MRKKAAYVLFGLFAIIKLIDYFSTNETEDFFGLEVGIWFHRILWSLMTIVFWLEFYKLWKTKKTKKSSSKENESIEPD